jgi:1-acyl-sn-glycerol-3-phosphate acyltransferase
MVNALVITSIITLFACYQILLNISKILAPKQADATTERYSRKAVRHIFGLMGFYCGLRLEYENRSGSALPDRFLLLANHQSLLDIPVCMALFPSRRLRFVAKRELGDGIPLVSLILRSQGHALIRRKGDATRAMRAIQGFAQRCAREGTCPVIFPEGTRSPDGQLGQFHTAGVRKILGEAPLPIVVAAIDGGWRIAKLKDILRNLGGARYRIRVLSITQPLSAKKEVLEAVARAHDEIAVGLAELRS